MSARTALVVDDDDSIRLVAEVALESVAGWKVLTAEGGAVALELAAAHRPDVILLDVMMPGMDGPTTCRHLSRDPITRDIPVILVTAKVQYRDREAWEDLPIVGVIPKPFDPMSLSAEVSAMLGWA